MITPQRLVYLYVSGEPTGVERFLNPDELYHFNSLLRLRMRATKTAALDEELLDMVRDARKRERIENKKMIKELKSRP